MNPERNGRRTGRRTGNRRRQRGVALFIALVVLLIITILGISGVETTTIEERMAGSARDHDVAFQSAESGLIAAEAFVEGMTPVQLAQFENNANGYFEPADPGDEQRWETVDWLEDATLPAAGAAIPGATAPAVYIVEHVSQVRASEDELNISNIGEQVGAPTEIFRITAYGRGGTATSSALVQSTFGKIVQ